MNRTNQKGFAHVLLLLLVVGIFAAGGWWLWSTGQLPILRTSPSSTDTTTWKTYENQEYGFSFKYPENWKVENVSTDGSKFLLTVEASSPDLQVSQVYQGGDFPSIVYKKGGAFYVYISPSDFYKTFEELKRVESRENTQVILIDGAEALSTPQQDNANQYSTYIRFLRKAKNEDQLLSFEIYLKSSPRESKIYTEVLNQILSTFEFSDVDITGWKTFTSDAGYQVKYPPTLGYVEDESNRISFVEDVNMSADWWFYIDESGEMTLAERTAHLQDKTNNLVISGGEFSGRTAFVVTGSYKDDENNRLIKNYYIDLNGKELILGCDTNQQCHGLIDQIAETFTIVE